MSPRLSTMISRSRLASLPLMIGLLLLPSCIESSGSTNEPIIEPDRGVSTEGYRDASTESDQNLSTKDRGVVDVVIPLTPAPGHHRPAAVECDNVRSDAPSHAEPEFADCVNHDECTAGANGRCVGNSHDGWYCTYDECFNDSECPGSICGCDAGFRSDHNICFREGNCIIDADCGDSGYCSPSFGDCGNYSGVVGYFCHTSGDECLNDSDCGTDEPWGAYCAYNKVAGKWVCSDAQCAG